ncbi:MAG: glycerol-3-phosphate dehydrogenase/oxidase [Acidobacteria bacterium]|nr:glycerol-3-phosphate dehydrogenase/oxidase [Acidobacteriota bacterium]
MTSNQRRQQIERLRGGEFDVLVIGGGINGAGLIRDLVLRAVRSGTPLRIALAEKNHFGSGTSGRNSHLIHGGLRYLKNLELSLVREALHERATLVRIGNGLVQPIPFLIPFENLRKALFYRTGLWLYDRLAGSRQIANHRGLGARELSQLEPALRSGAFSAAAEFWDCYIQSGRFVLENVFEAIGNGAAAANYLECTGWRRDGAVWQVTGRDRLTGETWGLSARKLVDARGPWAGGESLRLVRGSHLILPRIGESGHAVAYFEPGGRIIFFIPYGTERQFTLVGTTDVDHDGGPDEVHISAEELDYLMAIARRVFRGERVGEPICAFSSLRPLLRDDSASPTRASREHRIWNDTEGILHIAGGKYTTYRLMSEQAGDMLCRELAPSLEGVHLTAETPVAGLPPASRRDEVIARAAHHEMAQHLADLLFVSTTWGYEQRWDETLLLPYAIELGRNLGWEEDRIAAEIRGVLDQAERMMPRHSPNPMRATPARSQ